MGPRVFFVVFFYGVSSEKVVKLKEVEEVSWAMLLNRHITPGVNLTREELATELASFVNNLNQTVDSNNRNNTCKSYNDQQTPRCQRSENLKCLSSEELFGLLPNTTATLGDALNHLCPVLLSQVYHGLNCHPSSIESKPKLRPSAEAVWGIGILCITVISACSLVGVVLLPLLNKRLFKNMLMLFEGLAVGSLASSAIFHLIPQAFNLLGQDAEHDYLWKAAIIFTGIYVFFVSEHLMKIIIEAKKKNKKRKEMKNKSLLSNTSFTVDSLDKDSGSVMTYVNNLVKTADDETSNGDISSHLSTRRLSDQTEASLSYHNHDHGISFRGDKGIATVAWMIILGDGLHNFIDGLSIGAAFSESVLAGISISVAVVCEEFPHELGDFAVLLNAGMSMRQAITYNFLSACTCYIGFIFGVVLGDLAEGSYYIFAFAGGMFLYIALVDMMGELNEALKEAETHGTQKTLKIFFLQNVGIMIGVVTLFLLARYSEKINFHKESNAFDKVISNDLVGELG